MKKKLKRLCRKLGFEVTRVRGGRSQEEEQFPVCKRYDLGPVCFDFWVVSPSVAAWYPESWKDIGEFRELVRLVKEGDRVLELGSHQGFTGLILSALVGSSGSVLGVEANPGNVMVAHAQLGLNEVASNLSFIHAAAAESVGTVTMSFGHNSRVSTAPDESGLLVPGTTGDELDRRYGPFDFVKIDVEGFEGPVLRGCRGILERRPRVAIEVHVGSLSKYRSSVDEVFDLLNIEDYRGAMVVRPDLTSVVPFEVDLMPERGIVNLFLEPKQPNPA